MNKEIIAYIPQRAPFVMVDTVERADEEVSVTTFTIREGHMFVVNGHFTEPGLVENMAQTAAAGTGYRYQQSNMPAPVGYIGAIKSLNIYKLPGIGDKIKTEITFLHHVLNVHVVAGKIFVKEQEIANCEMKIFQQQEKQP